MDHQQGSDTQQGFWKDHNGHWHPFQVASQNGTASENPTNTQSSQASGVQPGPPSSQFDTSAGGPRAQVAHSSFPPHPPPQYSYQYPPHYYSHPPPPPPPLPLPAATPPPPTSSQWRPFKTPTPPSSEPELEFLKGGSASKTRDEDALPQPSNKHDEDEPRPSKKRDSDEPPKQPAKKAKSGPPKPRPVKGKGKATQAEDDAPSAETSKTSGHTGRAPGAQNYTHAELKRWLKILKKYRPISPNGWEACAKLYNKWAKKHGRPERSARALRSKFEQLANTPKPTGEGEVPPHVEDAYEVNELIEKKVHLRDISDDSSDDLENADSNDSALSSGSSSDDDSEIEIVDVPSGKKATGKSAKSSGPILKTSTSAPSTRASTSSRRTQASEFMGTIAGALDPRHREARDEMRFARHFAQAEIERLSQDNRDLRTRNDALQDRLLQLSMQLQQQQAENTRLQARLEMLELLRSSSSRSRYHEYSPHSPHTPRRYRSYSAVSPRTPRFDRDDHSDVRFHSPSPHASARTARPSSVVNGLDALASAASSSSHV